MSAARFLISGKVQGVWFRASTREQALHLGLTGYASNLADGRVEVVAIGENAVLAQLEQLLWRGPLLAEVEQVSREDLDEIPLSPGFRIA